MARYIKQCVYCDSVFEAARRDARYCQATCRVQASRDRRKNTDAPLEPVKDTVNMDTLLQLVERQNELIQTLMQTIERLQQPSAIQYQPTVQLGQSLPGSLGHPIEIEPLPEVKVRESKEDNGRSTQNFLNSLMALQN